jgi:hypothetical protein
MRGRRKGEKRKGRRRRRGGGVGSHGQKEREAVQTTRRRQRKGTSEGRLVEGCSNWYSLPTFRGAPPRGITSWSDAWGWGG